SPCLPNGRRTSSSPTLRCPCKMGTRSSINSGRWTASKDGCRTYRPSPSPPVPTRMIGETPSRRASMRTVGSPCRPPSLSPRLSGWLIHGPDLDRIPGAAGAARQSRSHPASRRMERARALLGALARGHRLLQGRDQRRVLERLRDVPVETGLATLAVALGAGKARHGDDRNVGTRGVLADQTHE